MNEVLGHLVNLTSPNSAVRIASQRHFQALRLVPETFVHQLCTILQGQVDMPMKKLALSLLTNFASLQEQPPLCVQLLEMVTGFYLEDGRINSTAVSKLLARLLEKVDKDVQHKFTLYLLTRSTPNPQQPSEPSCLIRAMMLLMEIYDDSETLVLPLDCRTVRKLAVWAEDSEILRRLILGVLSLQAVRTRFTAEDCLQLSEILELSTYECNKPATLSYLIAFLDRKFVDEKELLMIHRMLEKYFGSTFPGEELDIIGLISRLSNVLFSNMLKKTTFMQEPPFLRQEYIRDYLIWVHMLLSTHKDADVMHKQLLSNTVMFVMAGYEYLLTQSKKYFTELVLKDQLREQPFDWEMLNSSYLVLASITSDAPISEQTDMLLLKLAEKDLGNPFSQKLGILELFLAFSKKERSACVVADEIHLVVSDVLANNCQITPEEFQVVLKVLFGFQMYLTEQVLVDIFQYIDGHDEEERVDYLKCIETEFQTMEIDQEILSTVLDTLTFYQHEELPIRQILLNLTAIALSRSPKDEMTSSFIDVYDRLKLIEPKETAEVDSYCEAWCELLKIYNEASYDMGKNFLMDSCQKLDLFFKSASSDRLVEFLMEMIDLPPEHLTIINKVRDLLISQLPFENSKLYDLLEVYIILYPRTAEERAVEILKRLENHKEYYRMYFRLPPKLPLRQPYFQPTSIIEVKWVLLSVLNSKGKLTDFQLSKENPANLEQLTVDLSKLSLNESPFALSRWLDLLKNWKDSTQHWLESWPRNHISHKLKKDFAKWTKIRVEQLLELRPPMEIDY